MALIISPRVFYRWSGGVPFIIKGEASDFCTSISPIYLSEPYELNVGCKLEGRILKLEFASKEFSEFKDKEIELILYTFVGSDYLFISKKNWKENFRDYGFVEPFSLSLKIEKAIKDSSEIPLYPKRDVTI
jgi:hypothetical protein